MYGRKATSPFSATLTTNEPWNRKQLIAHKRAIECCEFELRRAQEIMTKQYERKCRDRHQFKKDDLVWIYTPARMKGIGKFRHRYRGPCRIINTDCGFDNYELIYIPDGRHILTHVSFIQPLNVRDDILDNEAKIFQEVEDKLNEYRGRAFDLDEIYEDEEISDDFEIIQRARVRNKSSRYEHRLLARFTDGVERWMSIDGHIID